jgi:hypothetical protein
MADTRVPSITVASSTSHRELESVENVKEAHAMNLGYIATIGRLRTAKYGASPVMSRVRPT